MARVRSFAPGTQNVKAHPTFVDCLHQTTRDGTGTKLLHLTTFGSDQRASHPKSSQSLQLDETAAKELIQILRTTFPGIG